MTIARRRRRLWLLSLCVVFLHAGAGSHALFVSAAYRAKRRYAPGQTACARRPRRDMHRTSEAITAFARGNEDADRLSQSSDANILLDRRAAVILSCAILMTPASASLAIASLPAASQGLGPGLLNGRVTENVLSPPPYGMEGPDVYYPEWFRGTWDVRSTCRAVISPCGTVLFGGGNADLYDRIRAREVGRVLRYAGRFVPGNRDPGRQSDALEVDADVVVADRAYNVASIARAAMGDNSVVDVSLATPNHFSCVLAPQPQPQQQQNASAGLLKVDLLTLSRRQETLSETEFDCSEVSREIAVPVGGAGTGGSNSRSVPSVLKEIETTSLYTLQNDGTIKCYQRSAAFLLPSQSSPLATKMWEASRGKPVDVRFYDVIYTKRA